MGDQGMQLSVPVEVAFQLKLMEFDKAITEAEAQVAEIKKRKMIFIYEQTMATVQQKYQKPADAPISAN